jgi:L,D-transpeptidase ErfK/SrfK
VYFFQDGELANIWPCATGKAETPTPTGRFEVTVTLEKPTWYWQGKAIPPGPDNGLGDWFIGINKKGYGLHGTNEPPSIGTAASHGCIRMYNDDAGDLVKLVSPGTPVVIVE